MKWISRLIVLTLSILALVTASGRGGALPVRAQSNPPPASPGNSWKGEVTGKVENKTPGANVNGPVEVMLHGWDPEGNEKLMLHGKSESNGRFRFENVDFQPGVHVLVMSSYQGAAYYSEAVEIQSGQNSLDFIVPIYETTKDPASVRVEALHLLFYGDQQALTVTQVYVLTNSGNRTVKDGVQLPSGRTGALKFLLPETAQNVTFDMQQAGRFILLSDGFADTAPLIPGSGSGQIRLKFNLAYNGSLDYVYRSPFPVEQVNILIPEETGLSLKGEGVVSQGVQSMEGKNYVIYSRPDLLPDEQLTLSLSGEPKWEGYSSAGQPPGKTTGSTNLSLGVGFGVLGVSLVIAGFWWWRMSDTDQEEQDTLEEDLLEGDEDPEPFRSDDQNG